MHRSYLFAPGHNAKLPAKVFDAGADAAMLDLEDAVPPDAEQVARAMVAEVLAEREGLGSDQRRAQPGVRGLRRLHLRAAQADLEVVAGVAAGIRIPKVESAEDAQWVADRAADTPPICAIESARGVLAAAEIATVKGVRHLSLGGVDLRRDLNTGDGNLQTLSVRSHLVVVSRAGSADRQRLPAARRRGRTSGAGDVRAFARLLRQVGDPPSPSCPSSTASSRRPGTSGPGRAGDRRLRQRRPRGHQAPER